jgi:hypothetical protein
VFVCVCVCERERERERERQRARERESGQVTCALEVTRSAEIFYRSAAEVFYMSVLGALQTFLRVDCWQRDRTSFQVIQFMLLCVSSLFSHVFSCLFSCVAGMGSSEGFFTSSIRVQHLSPDFFLRITYADSTQAEITWGFIRQYAAQYTFLPGFESLSQKGQTPRDGISVYLCNGPSICLGVCEYSLHDEQQQMIEECRRQRLKERFSGDICSGVIRSVEHLAVEEDYSSREEDSSESESD